MSKKPESKLRFKRNELEIPDEIASRPTRKKATAKKFQAKQRLDSTKLKPAGTSETLNTDEKTVPPKPEASIKEESGSTKFHKKDKSNGQKLNTEAEAMPKGEIRKEKRIEKAVRKAEAADSKFRKAKKKLQTAEKKNSSKLNFKKEEIEIPKTVRTVSAGAAETVSALSHAQNPEEQEEENPTKMELRAVSHFASGAAERLRGGGKFRPTKEVSKLCHKAEKYEHRAVKAGEKAVWETFRHNDATRKSNPITRLIYKKRLQSLYRAERIRKNSALVLTAGRKEAVRMRKIWKYGALAAMFLLVCTMIFSFASVSLMAVGEIFSSVVATSYPAKDPEITAADLYFSQLEAALQDEIDNIQETYPDYAAYVYELDGISHDPFQLMAYLSAMYEDFSFEEIKPELDALFAEAYSLTLETDGSTLYVKLEKRDFEEIFGPKLAEKGTSGMYDGYIDSRGNHQRFGTPFNFPWYDKISCLYGERDNPTGANTGYNLENGKEFHTGLDIAVPVGTPVYSVMEGTVTYAGWDNLYGWYVDVTDKDGNKSRYTHNSAILVNSGDKVLRGQAISESGRTGNVTGPHLHIEIFLDGERVNPIFLLEYQP